MSEIWSAATPGDKSKYFIQFLDMTNIQKMKESEINTKELVMEYIAAVNRKDFESARSYLSDNVSYRGPTGMGSFDKAEPYLKYLEHWVVNGLYLDVKKVFVDGNDVCEFHEVNIDTLHAPLLVCMWFHVDDGKINSIRIVFDPRPYLQEKRAR
jgi:limonene-1,2-epoxide hydrolase